MILLVALVILAMHEFAHALAAKALRIPVRRVIIGVGFHWMTLLRVRVAGVPVEVRPLPLGGCVQFEDETYSAAPPQARALVALAGPAINIITGLALLSALLGERGILSGLRAMAAAPVIAWTLLREAFSLASSAPAGPVAHLSVLASAAVISVLIGAFNLLPLPPLDGSQLALAALETAGIRSPRLVSVATGVGVAALALMSLAAFGVVLHPGYLAALAVGAGVGEVLRRLRRRLRVSPKTVLWKE